MDGQPALRHLQRYVPEQYGPGQAAADDAASALVAGRAAGTNAARDDGPLRSLVRAVSLQDGHDGRHGTGVAGIWYGVSDFLYRRNELVGAGGVAFQFGGNHRT